MPTRVDDRSHAVEVGAGKWGFCNGQGFFITLYMRAVEWLRRPRAAKFGD